MSKQSGGTKFGVARDCLAICTSVLTLLGGTFLVTDTPELAGRGVELAEITHGTVLLSGDAASLVVVALIGVSVISRRRVTL